VPEHDLNKILTWLNLNSGTLPILPSNEMQWQLEIHNKYKQVHRYTSLNMVIDSNIYKDALVLNELHAYIKYIEYCYC